MTATAAAQVPADEVGLAPGSPSPVNASSRAVPSGSLLLGMVPDEVFLANLQAQERLQARVLQVRDRLMTPGVDYDSLGDKNSDHTGPAVGRKRDARVSLLKPGAEKLCKVFDLHATFLDERIVADGVAAPAIVYIRRCFMHLGSTDGPIVDSGGGTASCWEKKYRYRYENRICPECGEPAIRQSTSEFYCWRKPGGCGRKFSLSDQRIVSQSQGKVANDDPHDLDNALYKIAGKRAYIDATIRACSSSDMFTQDVEDSSAARKATEMGRQGPVDLPPAASTSSGGRSGDDGPGGTVGDPDDGDLSVQEFFEELTKHGIDRAGALREIGADDARKIPDRRGTLRGILGKQASANGEAWPPSQSPAAAATERSAVAASRNGDVTANEHGAASSQDDDNVPDIDVPTFLGALDRAKVSRVKAITELGVRDLSSIPNRRAALRRLGIALPVAA